MILTNATLDEHLMALLEHDPVVQEYRAFFRPVRLGARAGAG